MIRAASIVAVLFAFALPATVSAQARNTQDLEVTISVVPSNAHPGAATAEIKLPENASPQAHDKASFGLDTANKARELRRDFGMGVAEQARERGRERIPAIERPNIGRP